MIKIIFCKRRVRWVQHPNNLRQQSKISYFERANHAKQSIKNHITKVFEQIPTYGEKKVHEQLLKDGIKVSQYTSEVHTQRLNNLGIAISMDGVGRATDNICIERFYPLRVVQNRVAKHQSWENLFEWIPKHQWANHWCGWLYWVLQSQRIPSDFGL